METIQGLTLEYKKPVIEVVDGEINVTTTTKKKFFSLDEIKSIIETKERQNLSSRMCYYRKKLALEEAEKALATRAKTTKTKTTKAETTKVKATKTKTTKAEVVDSESSKTEVTAK